jgi:hypothetical protein
VRSQRDDPDPHYRAGVVLSIGSRWPRVEGGDASVARARHDIPLILGHTTDARTSLTCVASSVSAAVHRLGTSEVGSAPPSSRGTRSGRTFNHSLLRSTVDM